MIVFKKKPLLFSPPATCSEYPFTPCTLLSSNPTCTNVTNLEDGNIRLTLKFESGVSVSIGLGIRVSIEATNEVSLLCVGNTQISADTTVDQFKVSYANNKKDRIVTFLYTDASKYRLTCKQVIIESHKQYCESENGTRTSVWEVAKQYHNNAPNMRNWLNEMKAKRTKNL